MYFPYFRGKQFELITIRETAALLAKAGFVPIIEPVRESLSGLDRTLQAIAEVGGRAIVVVNPDYGDHQADGFEIQALLQGRFGGSPAVAAGILLHSRMTVDNAREYFNVHQAQSPTLVHAGFTDPKGLAHALADELPQLRNVFIDDKARMLYRRHFDSRDRVLIRDGFRRQRNADYPELEEFSDLHATYRDLGMTGFGDFLIVGDEYSESGGPAYAVAIHITFIDPRQDDAMFVYHFISDTRDTPTDPAGKFGQALNKLVKKLDRGDSQILETRAIAEFRDFHARRHFPGLGYVKKLSMRHHIETLASYFG